METELITKGEKMLQEIDIGVGNEKVVAYQWEGSFDLAGFEQAKNKFLPDLKMKDRLNIFIEVVSLDKVEAQAVWKDLKLAASNFKEFSEKIDRIGLVTDVSWLKNITSASSAVYQEIKIKTFSPEEKEKAVRWVNEQSHVL